MYRDVIERKREIVGEGLHILRPLRRKRFVQRERERRDSNVTLACMGLHLGTLSRESWHRRCPTLVFVCGLLKFAWLLLFIDNINFVPECILLLRIRSWHEDTSVVSIQRNVCWRD